MRIMAVALLIASLPALLNCGGTSGEAVAVAQAPFNVGQVLATLGTDQLVFNSNRSGNHEIFVMKTDGSAVTQLTQDKQYDSWWPKISPDRKKILFYRAPQGKSENYAEASLWVVNADGGMPTVLRAKNADNWTQQGHAEWSPDGLRIAMFGSVGATLQVFVTDVQGKNPVQYTNRVGINTDVSWSRDGSKLLFNGCPSNPCTALDFEVYSMPATPFSVPTRITNDRVADYDPYFSPDGKSMAWLSTINPLAFPIGSANLGQWAIRIANADGTGVRDLINDGQVNSKPAWSTDSNTIFFHRMEPPDYRFRIFKINRDGTGLVELTKGAAGSSEYPSN
jgi:Tol biopolymer transport system component